MLMRNGYIFQIRKNIYTYFRYSVENIPVAATSFPENSVDVELDAWSPAYAVPDMVWGSSMHSPI